MIKLDRIICNDFSASTNREWLETNGLGGYAFGTVSGANSRRYHSFLTVAAKPPVGRVRTVSKLEETLIVDGASTELSSDRFPGVVSPDGYKLITEFRLDPFPIWHYEVSGVVLERKVFMIHGRHATVIRWRIVSGAESRNVRLELKPLLAYVDHHHLSHERNEFDTSYSLAEGIVTVQPDPSFPRVCFTYSDAEVAKTCYWYRNFEYAIEQERGFDFHEDLFQPFSFAFDLCAPADLIISTDEIDITEADKLERSEIRRRDALIAKANAKNDLTKQLTLAADQFIVSRGNGQTVIAGYPWFSDWGRDTMISLYGLSLATGRPPIAKNILLEFSKHVSEGMLPNRFSDEDESADYNTVDATLWYFEAVRAYIETTGGDRLVKKHLYAVLSDIISWHLRGTRHNIHVDTDGLLYAGDVGLQLTWMDAKVGDNVITPRTGKPVEVQALWYNALVTMAEFASELAHEKDAKKFRQMADLAKLSFNALFWNSNDNCLFDVIKNGSRDASVRPNQIFAASLKHSMLNHERAKAVVDKVESELLTPYGLRTLSPRDPKYIPYYTGSPLERDAAYHQGTVWPWLLGAFVDAYRRVYPDRAHHIAEIIEPFAKHLSQTGLGSISEIFDAERPHSPRGCPAQAWSVAEILRIAMTF